MKELKTMDQLRIYNQADIFYIDGEEIVVGTERWREIKDMKVNGFASKQCYTTFTK